MNEQYVNKLEKMKENICLATGREQRRLITELVLFIERERHDSKRRN
ncbi:hypothetical protein [Bacillus suaedae]|uniref:Uncharacterized protein n=1 Tax=Halalkalibacter suaedae TaxID=2822140 RepID=A0A941ALP8_9BACI|nr:hypothetical protein [Bacillus suaedae]MBP3949630.1 hypothetical protein [Bacillus suaedae]